MNIAIPKENGNGYHLLTNEGLKIGDKVFSLLFCYHNKDKIYVIDIRLHNRDKRMIEACTGWPNDPHTIKEFYREDGLQYIRTDMGYSPAYVYFKLIGDE